MRPVWPEAWATARKSGLVPCGVWGSWEDEGVDGWKSCLQHGHEPTGTLCLPPLMSSVTPPSTPTQLTGLSFSPIQLGT